MRALSGANIELLGEAVSLASPDGQVRLARSVEPALLGAAGNVAVTGVPGSGKTVLLHTLADSARDTHDLVVLRSDDLRSSKGATRAELGPAHDLSEVLAGWSGRRPGLVLIDGIDQARGADAPGWLPTLASALSGTRWQIAATIRSLDVQHSQSWKDMFPGVPVDAGAADRDLARVGHLLAGDLTGEELGVVRAASPHLAGLLDEASPAFASCSPTPSTWTWPDSSSPRTAPASCKSTPELNCSPNTGAGASGRGRQPWTGRAPCAFSSARCSPAAGKRSARLTCRGHRGSPTGRRPARWRIRH